MEIVDARSYEAVNQYIAFVNAPSDSAGTKCPRGRTRRSRVAAGQSATGDFRRMLARGIVTEWRRPAKRGYVRAAHRARPGNGAPHNVAGIQQLSLLNKRSVP